MASKSLTSEQVLNLLDETPQRIAELTDGLTPAQLRTIPGDGEEWSANDVLAHLRSCADVWGGCMEAILAEDHPTIRAINPTTWIKSTDYPELEFRPSFDAFLAQRADLLATLEPLLDDAWSRGATVTGAGRPLERTVLSYGQWLASHERTHVRQIRNIVNAVQE